MSDNDLIYRGDVREKIECAIEVLVDLGLAWEIYSPLWDAITAIGDISAVSQEMSAREYHNIVKRMLKTDMRAFNMWWDSMCWLDGDKALAFAEKWAREHPGKEVDNSDMV